MFRLKRIFSASIIAFAGSSASASANVADIQQDIESFQENHVTSSSISKRAKHYNLDSPSCVLKKNAHRSTGVVQYDELNYVKDSVGWFDMRRPVCLDEKVYDAVLQVDLEGERLCTIQAVDIEGFALKPPYQTAFALSAHCVEKTDKDDNFVRNYHLDEIEISGSYLADDGKEVNYNITADALWKNYLYSTDKISGDKAFIFSKTALPSNVQPFKLLTKNDVDLVKDDMVSVAGYSGDYPFLTSDDCSLIKNVRHAEVKTTADMVVGASGGPVLLSAMNAYNECVYTRADNGAAITVGVNRGILSGTNIAFHLSYTKSELNTILYLRPVQQVDDGRCVQAAKIIQSSFAYTLPNEHSVRLFSKEYHWRPVQIKTGQDVTYFGSEKDSLGRNWAFIKFKDNEQIERHGYMLKNRMLKQQEICFNF